MGEGTADHGTRIAVIMLPRISKIMMRKLAKEAGLLHVSHFPFRVTYPARVVLRGFLVLSTGYLKKSIYDPI
jgi:hypothetical protein